MILPEKLVYLRKQKGLSQEELAEMMALSRQSISRWESGGAVPGIDSLKLLSRLYGVSVDYLLDVIVWTHLLTQHPRKPLSRCRRFRSCGSMAGSLLLS